MDSRLSRARFTESPALCCVGAGFLDTVVEGVTGVYFDNPDPRSIAQAVTALEEIEWDPRVIANHTSQFSEEMFSSEMRHHVDKLVQYA